MGDWATTQEASLKTIFPTFWIVSKLRRLLNNWVFCLLFFKKMSTKLKQNIAISFLNFKLRLKIKPYFILFQNHFTKFFTKNPSNNLIYDEKTLPI